MLNSLARDGPSRIHQYGVLEQSLLDFANFPLVSFDQAADVRFHELRFIRIGTQARKIASIALSQQLTVVTANRRDFSQVPGLALEDWSA